VEVEREPSPYHFERGAEDLRVVDGEQKIGIVRGERLDDIWRVDVGWRERRNSPRLRVIGERRLPLRLALTMRCQDEDVIGCDGIEKDVECIRRCEVVSRKDDASGHSFFVTSATM
jgi:hypothetical protein